MGILLTLIAYILLAVLAPFGILYAFIKSIIGNVNLNNYFFNLAISLDQTGNAVMCKMFDDCMLTKDSKAKYSDPDETLSSVYGKNKRDGTLTWLGKGIAYILNKLERNHIEKAIEENP